MLARAGPYSEMHSLVVAYSRYEQAWSELIVDSGADVFEQRFTGPYAVKAARLMRSFETRLELTEEQHAKAQEARAVDAQYSQWADEARRLSAIEVLGTIESNVGTLILTDGGKITAPTALNQKLEIYLQVHRTDIARLLRLRSEPHAY